MEDIVHNSTGSRRFPMPPAERFFFFRSWLCFLGGGWHRGGWVGSYGGRSETHEIGIRMALGRGKTVDVLRLMVNSSMIWVLVGASAPAFAGSAGLTRLLAGMLYERAARSIPWYSVEYRFLLAAVALLRQLFAGAPRRENRSDRGVCVANNRRDSRGAVFHIKVSGSDVRSRSAGPRPHLCWRA